MDSKKKTSGTFDWKFYLLMNPDIEASGCPHTEKAAREHWNVYGQYENRLHVHSDSDIFDVKYYFKQYTDVQSLKSVREIIQHWYRHGKQEGRLCCHPEEQRKLKLFKQEEEVEKMIRVRLQDLLPCSLHETTSPVENNTEQIHEGNPICIRIITRTSRRPKAFRLCQLSIASQILPLNSKVCHHILYDNPLDTHYVLGDMITPVQMKLRKSSSEFPANEYINTALSITHWKEQRIHWNIVLDDDDMFKTSYAIKEIVSCITDRPECKFIMWNTEINREKILPHRKPWVCSNVPSCSFAFKGSPPHKWTNQKGGDFEFVDTLVSHLLKHEIYHIQKTLTALQNKPGWGHCLDLPILPIRSSALQALQRLRMAVGGPAFSNKRANVFADFFTQTYVLNLDRRVDRFTKTMQRFKEYNITQLTRFSGIDGKYDMNFQVYWNKYLERKHQTPCIPSIGSFAILHSMRKLLEQSKKNCESSCMIFQDDILLCSNFRKRCFRFLDAITQAIPDWKLIYLGCTQHIWPKHLFQTDITRKIGWYYPQGTADGAFAVAINGSIYDELLKNIGTTKLPFDSGPLREIQKRWPTKCVCAWPYLVIADVRDSDCRESRSQNEMCRKVRWNLDDFNIDGE
jgi:hypothetical protein